MSLINKARSDKRVQELLSSIEKKVKIKYRKEKNGGWTSNMQGDIADIGYSGCRHPSASLAHELLHLDTQIRGYKRMRIFISSIDQTNSFKILMDALDNELQHQKFYNNFISMGFNPDQFYHDSDSDTEAHLKKLLQSDFDKIVDVIPHYLTVISPGGSFSSNTRDELKASFLAINDGIFSDKLTKIEQIIFAWATSSTYDATEVVREIMLTIQPENNLTWIGHNFSDRPPDNGFFVDEAFSVQAPN